MLDSAIAEGGSFSSQGDKSPRSSHSEGGKTSIDITGEARPPLRGSSKGKEAESPGRAGIVKKKGKGEEREKVSSIQEEEGALEGKIEEGAEEEEGTVEGTMGEGAAQGSSEGREREVKGEGSAEGGTVVQEVKEGEEPAEEKERGMGQVVKREVVKDGEKVKTMVEREVLEEYTFTYTLHDKDKDKK